MQNTQGDSAAAYGTSSAVKMMEYSSILQGDPTNAEANFQLGNILVVTSQDASSSEFLNGVKYLEYAKDLGLDTGEFWRSLGGAYLKKWEASRDEDDAQQALTHLENAMKFPDNAQNPTFLAEVSRAYEASGAYEGALDILSSIILSFPNSSFLPDIIFRAAELNMHPQVRNLKESIKYFEYIMMNPPEPYTEELLLFQLARAYSTQGRKKLARDAFRECFGKIRNKEHKFGQKSYDQWLAQPDLWLHKGKWHEKNGNFILAVDAYIEVLTLQDPTSAESLFRYAMCMNAIGLKEDATEALNSAIPLDRTYSLEYRKRALEWDPGEWFELFEQQDQATTDVQKIVRGCWGRIKGRAYMVKERARRKHLNDMATEIERVWRGLLGRRYFIECKIRYERYCFLVEKSFKRMRNNRLYFFINQWHNRAVDIIVERQKAIKAYHEILINKNIKRMKQRTISAAYNGWYDNVQEIIAERIRVQNFSANSICYWYRFLCWRFDRRIKEAKIKAALFRMKNRFKIESMRLWCQYVKDERVIKAFVYNAKHRMKKAFFGYIRLFFNMERARKKRFAEKMKLREERFCRDVKYFLEDTLLRYGGPQSYSKGSMEWRQRMKIASFGQSLEQKLRKKHLMSSDAPLSFQAQLLGLKDEQEIPRQGSFQTQSYKTETKYATSDSPPNPLKKWSWEPKALPKLMMKDAGKSAAELFPVLWPKSELQTTCERVAVLTGSYKSLTNSTYSGLAHSSSKSNSNIFPLPGTIEGKTNRPTLSPLFMTKREIRENKQMQLEELEQRRVDDALRNQMLTDDRERFQTCITFAGPLKQELFCSLAWPGRSYERILFKSVSLIQLWWLIFSKYRSNLRESSASKIQTTFFRYLDRKERRRKYILEKSVNMMTLKHFGPYFIEWRRVVARAIEVRMKIRDMMTKRTREILIAWRLYTVNRQLERDEIMEKAARRMRQRFVAACFDKLLEHKERSFLLRYKIYCKIMERKRTMFNMWLTNVESKVQERIENEAATRLQKHSRGLLERSFVRKMRKEHTAAVNVIQRFFRVVFAKKAVRIVRKHVKYTERKRLRKEFTLKAKEERMTLIREEEERMKRERVSVAKTIEEKTADVKKFRKLMKKRAKQLKQESDKKVKMKDFEVQAIRMLKEEFEHDAIVSFRKTNCPNFQKHHLDENLRFWVDCEVLQNFSWKPMQVLGIDKYPFSEGRDQNDDPNTNFKSRRAAVTRKNGGFLTKQELLYHIYDTYIELEGTHPISIPTELKDPIEKTILGLRTQKIVYSEDLTNIFRDAQRFVFWELASDGFRRFIKSPEYHKVLEMRQCNSNISVNAPASATANAFLHHVKRLNERSFAAENISKTRSAPILPLVRASNRTNKVVAVGFTGAQIGSMNKQFSSFDQLSSKQTIGTSKVTPPGMSSEFSAKREKGVVMKNQRRRRKRATSAKMPPKKEKKKAQAEKRSPHSFTVGSSPLNLTESDKSVPSIAESDKSDQGDQTNADAESQKNVNQ
eukprot:g4006.t1